MAADVQTAIAMIRGGDREPGAQLLRRALRENPTDEQAWLWMSAVVDTADERRECLERVLAINGQNPAALRGLALLKGVAPATLPASPATHPSPAAGSAPASPAPAEAAPVSASPPSALAETTPLSLQGQPAMADTSPTVPPTAVLAYHLLGKPLGAVVVSVGFTAMSYMAALEAAAGSRPEIRGRYQLFKQLYAWFIITLGPAGVLVVGSTICILSLLWLGMRTRALMRLRATSGRTRALRDPAERPAPARQSAVMLRGALVLLIAGAGLAAGAAQFLRGQSATVSYEPVVVPFPTLAIPTAVGGGPLIIDNRFVADFSNQGLVTVSLDELRGQPISILNLSGNPLEAIPAEIGDLDQIQYLFLSNVGLTQLPPEIADMESLRGLVLTDNALTELPPSIGRLQHLERLDIAGNHISKLPPEVAQLTSLSELDVRGNPLDARDIPPGLASRPGLVVRADPESP